MSDLESRLTDALNTDNVPVRDAMFRLEVLVRLERERFRRQVRRTMTIAAPLIVLAALIVPELNAWITVDTSRLWFVALTTAAATSTLTVLMTFPRLRVAARGVTRLLYP